jgi:2-isopropylmalate synthase
MAPATDCSIDELPGASGMKEIAVWSQVAERIKRALIRMHKRRGVVMISDTTLRDGEQMPGINLLPDQKVEIARGLADAGVHSIDCGFPAAAPSEIESIRRIAREVHGPVLAAHSRTVRGDIDAAARALEGVRGHKRAINLFIGISPIHRERKHQKSKAEIVRMATEAIQYARQFFHIISFGPEDASRTEPEFLHEVYREAIAAGATTIGFADTVGILTPEKAADRIRAIQDHVSNIDDALIGVHFHNDLGLATANALACVATGANVVQGTINGIGERAGNTAIEEVVMTLVLHRDQYGVKVAVDPRKLTPLSQIVSELTGVPVPANKAVVGSNIFATGSGVHQDGLLKDPTTYLPFQPAEVGAGGIELVLGKHSGRSAVRHRFRECGLELNEDQVQMVVQHLKQVAGSPLRRSDAELAELLRDVFGTTDAVPPSGPPRTRLAG